MPAKNTPKISQQSRFQQQMSRAQMNTTGGREDILTNAERLKDTAACCVIGCDVVSSNVYVCAT